MRTRYRLYRSTGSSIIVAFLYALLGMIGHATINRAPKTDSTSTPVRHYQGNGYRYCMGSRETARRARQISRGIIGVN